MTETQLNTFLAGFTFTATGDHSTPGSVDVKRKMLAQYIKDANETSPSYEMLGYKQTSLATASNYDSESITDVTGATYLDVNGKAETLEMSEYKLNPAKTKFMGEAIKLKLSDQEQKMNNYTVLHVYGYLRDEDDNCLAVEESGCTMLLDNEGGEGFVTDDVSITLSGIKKFGTVAEITGTPTFTEYVPSSTL